MSQKMLRVVLCVVTIAGLSFGLMDVRADDQQKPSLQEQVTEILKSQKSIEQRLSAIETKQTTIMYSLQALAGQPRPAAAQAVPPAEDLNKVYKIDMGRSFLKGNKNAKVTIVEFSDFQCPYSQRFHPVVNEVLKAYPKDVNYVLKNFPLTFHPQARPAAKASLTAGGQGKYWEMVELLFQSGRELSETKYQELAKQLGLNADKFMKDYKNNDAEWEQLIKEDMTVAGSSDVRGTPTFFINGKRTNARDMVAFKQEIDKILQGGEEDAKKDN